MSNKYIKIIDLVQEYNALKCQDSRQVDVELLQKMEAIVKINHYDSLVMEFHDSINVCADIYDQLEEIDDVVKSTIRIKWNENDEDEEEEEEMTVDAFMARFIGMLINYDDPNSEPSLQHLYDIVYDNKYSELLLEDMDLKDAYDEAREAHGRLYKKVMKCVLF